MSTASQASASSRPSNLQSNVQQRRKPDHPKGCYVLCAVELFERFAGTLLGSFLLLYLNERLGMTTGSATRLGGTFNAAIYLSSVIGGVIADRWLGIRRAMLLGALLLALGYTVLSMDRSTLLYPAAGLLMLGHALFKPSISRAVGKLYLRNDPRRDDAFSLFYVVFNIGSGCGPIAGGFLRSQHWHLLPLSYWRSPLVRSVVPWRTTSTQTRPDLLPSALIFSHKFQKILGTVRQRIGFCPYFYKA